MQSLIDFHWEVLHSSVDSVRNFGCEINQEEVKFSVTEGGAAFGVKNLIFPSK